MEGEERKLASATGETDPVEPWPKGRKRTRGASKYGHLLEESQSFNAWYRNVLRGSYNTGAWYLPRMGRLCDELTKTSPAQMAKMNRAEFMTYVSGFVSDLEEAGVSGVTNQASS